MTSQITFLASTIALILPVDGPLPSMTSFTPSLASNGLAKASVKAGTASPPKFASTTSLGLAVWAIAARAKAPLPPSAAGRRPSASSPS